ncbi:hypothetical protein EMIHUDRAFT_231623 [Emiliania huxleyi CCMP1516]|uniref:Uncharacterized protein n=2 Tax=Emiliania huxleyi TaxID=2903 RepID=A0A0D3K7A9_EMIH1|nr:hypothetical protein EMIHUDRAFT_231623 [Emiliania huxleyi CCMP1516]EOD31644.1 hypothetical protein EMIHUDRAFT_231623 [Emiliania huxleyi CCMP1516]|eukprot:XP_005784073.1 hypothetical protein EMIHUDRAFT_231623 [Emiliania huxleyi CCMP1516]
MPWRLLTLDGLLTRYADGIYSQHDLPFDALGDVAQNDGAAGHQTRGTRRVPKKASIHYPGIIRIASRTRVYVDRQQNCTC